MCFILKKINLFSYRYKAFDNLADQIITVMKGAMTLGQVNHAVSMAGTVDQCDAHVNKPAR